MKHVLILVIAVFGFTSFSCSGEEDGGGDVIAKDIKADEMKNVLDKDGIIILDVRTPGETSRGMIPGAIEIDFNGGNFEKQVEKLAKDKPIYIYCASGGRSKRAQNLMKDKGFKETYNLLGGFNNWSQQGYPTK